jgi:hypothetical protein
LARLSKLILRTIWGIFIENKKNNVVLDAQVTKNIFLLFSGESGGWRNYFTAEQAEKFDLVMIEKLGRPSLKPKL